MPPSCAPAGCFRHTCFVMAVARRCWLRLFMTYSTKTARASEIARIAGCLAGAALDRAEAHGPGVACEACGTREELPWEDYPRTAVVKVRWGRIGLGLCVTYGLGLTYASHVCMRRAHHGDIRAFALGLVRAVHSVPDELRGRRTRTPWRTPLSVA